MQRDTYNPVRIIETDAGRTWHRGRDENGNPVYVSGSAPGRRPSSFYSHLGRLLPGYRIPGN